MEPSQAKVTGASVFKILPFLLCNVLSVKNAREILISTAREMELQRQELNKMPALVDVTLRRTQPGPWGFRMQVF